MKLPNGENAVVEIGKFAEYSLNPEHPTGRHKAHVFQSILGLTLKDAAYLQEKVRDVARTRDAAPESPTFYGHRYVIDFDLTTETGTAIVRSAWIIRNDEDFPRLTSCYVK